MAAAALIQKAARSLGVAGSLDNTETRSEGAAGEIEAEKEKQTDKTQDRTLVAAGYLEPEQAVMASREEGMGAAKEVLGVADFEMVRILGTGTFARVWLVRMKNPRNEDEKQVFALKVLRKAEVIKLKQVNHVNHERAILADVAGHPFITTLLATFSDRDCLYMLVRLPPLPPQQPR